jgi:hypothetical protein
MADDGAKALVPFMQRANEVQRTHPRVAYYCACAARSGTEALRAATCGGARRSGA